MRGFFAGLKQVRRYPSLAVGRLGLSGSTSSQEISCRGLLWSAPRMVEFVTNSRSETR
jgi:hypothetical protein